MVCCVCLLGSHAVVCQISMLDVTDKGNQCLLGLLYLGYKRTDKVLQHEPGYLLIPHHSFIHYNRNIRGNTKDIAEKNSFSNLVL